MKNLTTFVVTAIWFLVAGLVAFGLTNPEMFTESGTHQVSGHGVNQTISNLGAIIALAVPFAIGAITLTVSYVWYKDTSKQGTTAKA